MGPPGTRFGGRADLRSRLLGAGVLGADDLPEAQLILEELADERVLERFRQTVRLVRVRDLDAFMKVVRRGKIALGQLVHTRVLEVPDRPGLADDFAFETNEYFNINCKDASKEREESWGKQS